MSTEKVNTRQQIMILFGWLWLAAGADLLSVLLVADG